MAVAYTPLWVEGMTAGRGWIALALVVFATWKPWRILAGAYLFGGVTLAQFQAQAIGVDIPSQYLSMLPSATIVVLAIISRDAAAIRLNAPASPGKPFHPIPRSARSPRWRTLTRYGMVDTSLQLRAAGTTCFTITASPLHRKPAS
jgi:hypothetical protein